MMVILIQLYNRKINQILRGNNNGKANLTKLLLNQDKGDYFDENGEIRRDSGVRLISNMRLN